MSDDDRDPDWVGSAEPEELQSGSLRSRHGIGVPVVLAGIAAVVVVAALAHGGSPPPPRPSSRPAAAPIQPPPTGRPVRAAPQSESRVGVPLLGIKAKWELFGRGAADVVRIEFARGIVTRTSVPVLRSNGPVSFVVGPQGAVIRPLDLVPGYLVPDGHFAHPLRSGLSHGGLALPGPRPGQLWVQTGGGPRVTMSLINRGGHRTGTHIRVAKRPEPVTSDGNGYLLVTAPNGVYDVRPNGRRRVGTGHLLAVGPTRWLTRHCDGTHHCATVLIDRRGGTRGVLAHDVKGGPYRPTGVISPDGTITAMPIAHSTKVGLVDLASGIERPLGISVAANGVFGSQVAWSPDSRWLFVATARGELVAVPVRTGHVRRLGVALPNLSQLAVRDLSGS